MRWLDRIPLALLAAAPFVPEPHLWEKLGMLAAGTLSRPIDIFDLFWHGIPLMLLAMKLARMAHVRKAP